VKVSPPMCPNCRHYTVPMMGLAYPECWSPHMPRDIATGRRQFTVHARELRLPCGPEGKLFERMPQWLSPWDRFLAWLGF
jgi:hypothetical protein